MPTEKNAQKRYGLSALFCNVVSGYSPALEQCGEAAQSRRTGPTGIKHVYWLHLLFYIDQTCEIFLDANLHGAKK